MSGMLKHLGVLAVFFGLSASLLPGATIVGGATSVTFNSTFLGLGLTVTPNPPATLNGATAVFPITGGDTDPLLITHSGTLTLSAGISSIELGNFTINGTTGLVLGDVIGVGTQLDLFNIEPGLVLSLTGTSAGALNATFGTSLVSGLAVATASPDITAVPEPASAALLLAGAGACAFLRRRHQAVR